MKKIIRNIQSTMNTIRRILGRLLGLQPAPILEPVPVRTRRNTRP